MDASAPQPDDADLVDQGSACPICGERHPDKLVWLDDDVVECQQCGCRYQP
jgi:hypothetical protein